MDLYIKKIESVYLDLHIVQVFPKFFNNCARLVSQNQEEDEINDFALSCIGGICKGRHMQGVV